MIKEIKREITFFATRKAAVSRISTFLSYKILPTNMTIGLSNTLFDLTLEKRYTKRLDLVKRKIEVMIREVEEVPMPLWHTNFSAFFGNMVENINNFIDPELFYFSHTDYELSLTRSLFYGNSSRGREIDKFIKESSKNDFKDFPDKIIDFFTSLVPAESLQASKEQSISLLIFYRAITDRVYETHPYSFDPSEYLCKSDTKDKMFKMYKMKMSQMTLPKGLSPIGSPDEEARECFLKNKLFAKATETFLCAFFTTNPIDGLYYIHSVMSDIHKAAIYSQVEREPTFEELKQILGFDDMFSLFFGVLISSDVPDIFQLYLMMKKFAPRTCLSPMFEYANANLEALVIHCQKLLE
jgi:hypothetical protein